MVALMDPANLLLPGVSGLPSLAQPFPCSACALGKKMVPHPQRSLPLWEQSGAHPTQPGASTAAVGLVGHSWDWTGCCGGCQARAAPRLLWVDVGAAHP